MEPRVVWDTNVIVSALRSQRGASFLLLSLVGKGHFTLCLSVPLMLEYEDVLLRQVVETGLTRTDVEEVLDYLSGASEPSSIYYLWRPYLRDPKDDMVLELAVASRCSRIVTYNLRDFGELRHFAIEAVTPARFLRELGEIS